jgi:hypothetical protein
MADGVPDESGYRTIINRVAAVAGDPQETPRPRAP